MELYSAAKAREATLKAFLDKNVLRYCDDDIILIENICEEIRKECKQGRTYYIVSLPLLFSNNSRESKIELVRVTNLIDYCFTVLGYDVKIERTYIGDINFVMICWGSRRMKNV